MNNQIKNTANFEKLVKIRIGEPLTAVEIYEDTAIFGSISGYVGSYNVQSKELVYVSEVFEEIIRGFEVKENGFFNALVGDHSLVQMYINEMKQKEKIIKINFPNHSSKKPNICASTMTFINKNSVAMLQANPTQNKDQANQLIDYHNLQREYVQRINQHNNNNNNLNYLQNNQNNIVFDSNDSASKGLLQVLKIDKQQWRNYTQMNLPQISVPFDYDGERLIWLEYKEQGIKDLAIYELNTAKTFPIYQFNKSIEFISHVKLLSNFIIFVQDHLHVKALNIKDKKIYDLYSHSQSIQALSASYNGEAITKQNDEEVGLQYSEINVNQIIINSIDFNCNFKRYINQKNTHNVPLLKQQNVPDIIKNHKYIFDMGYPYYIKSKPNLIAFTSDFGLCVFHV